jgi:hypothetical protein
MNKPATPMREIGDHLDAACAAASHALAHWREGDLVEAFRLVVKARVQLAAAQGGLMRAGAADLLLMRGGAAGAKHPSEQGGAPA